MIKTVSISKSALLIFSMAGMLAFGQKKVASPRDSVKSKINGTMVSVNYGSPSVKDRKIWGELVPYGKVWRAGANEATTFTTDKTIMVEGKPLAAGKYGFFVIPTEKEWTIIFNKTSDQWGAYEYKEKDDVLRVTVNPKKVAAKQERLVYKVNDKGLILAWENLEVPVSIK